MVTSFQKTLVEFAKKEYGDFHVSVYDVEKEDIKKVKESKDVENIMAYECKGFSKLEGLKNEYKPYLCLLGMERKLLNNLKLLEGRFPENENEIVISKHIEENGGVKYKIGDTVNLEISDRISDGFKLSQDNMYYPEKAEILNKKYDKEYKIVGIIERPTTFIESRQAPRI